ncbi:hypothetical protein B0H14DRAFT_3433560 [Mycena olivaceomarginata]|nr:hypothetical protein B0H14DRAFT_3433560 [Mycena olivaceomarginata]
MLVSITEIQSFHAVRPPAALTWRQREPITSMEWTAHSTQAALPGLNKTFLRAIRTAAASPVAFDARGGSQVIVLPCITTGSGRRWRQRRRDAVRIETCVKRGIHPSISASSVGFDFPASPSVSLERMPNAQALKTRTALRRMLSSAYRWPLRAQIVKPSHKSTTLEPDDLLDFDAKDIPPRADQQRQASSSSRGSMPPDTDVDFEEREEDEPGLRS